MSTDALIPFASSHPANRPVDQPPASVRAAIGAGTSDRLFALVHPRCGHAAAISVDRAQLEEHRDGLHALGQHAWRVRVCTADADEIATVSGLIPSEPAVPRGCETCDLTPVLGGPS